MKSNRQSFRDQESVWTISARSERAGSYSFSKASNLTLWSNKPSAAGLELLVVLGVKRSRLISLTSLTGLTGSTGLASLTTFTSVLLLLLLNCLLGCLLALVPVGEEDIAGIRHDLEFGAYDDNARLDEAILALRLLVLILPCAGNVSVRCQCNFLDLGGVLLDDRQVSLELGESIVAYLVGTGQVWVNI